MALRLDEILNDPQGVMIEVELGGATHQVEPFFALEQIMKVQGLAAQAAALKGMDGHGQAPAFAEATSGERTDTDGVAAGDRASHIMEAPRRILKSIMPALDETFLERITFDKGMMLIMALAKHIREQMPAIQEELVKKIKAPGGR